MRRLKGLGMAFTILLALSGLAVANDKKDYRGGSIEARQHGYEHGYRDGFHHGREDRERGGSYNFRTEDYKDGERGYDKYMGDKGDYKKGYRQGYEGGYGDAYYARPGRFGDIYGRRDDDRYRDRGPYDDIYESRRRGYSDVAFDTGYRDGLTAGRKDLDRHEDFDPNDHDDYRDADHGYRDGYGSKDTYKREYRNGFLEGYQNGFGRRR